jgi:hypothetical protein
MYKPKSKNRRFEEGRRQKVRQPPSWRFPSMGDCRTRRAEGAFSRGLGLPVIVDREIYDFTGVLNPIRQGIRAEGENINIPTEAPALCPLPCFYRLQ